MRQVDPETVGEYTGWQDQNGNYVYAGDLFETEDWSDPERIALLEVVWDSEAGFSLEPFEGVAECQPIRWVEDHVIAGNIHDREEI